MAATTGLVMLGGALGAAGRHLLGYLAASLATEPALVWLGPRSAGALRPPV